MTDSRVNSGKAAIFDLDGTLLDSMGVWEQVDIDFFARRGLPLPSDYMETVSGMQYREIARYTIDRFGLSDSEDALMQEWDDMAREAYVTVVQPKSHAVQYVHYLKETGARLAVATTILPTLREPALEHVGLLDVFDAIVGVENATGRGKEHPDIYLEAARQCDIKPEDCTVFEDLLAGIRAAQSVHMKTWGVYDASSRATWNSITAIADGAITDFSQAPRVL